MAPPTQPTTTTIVSMLNSLTTAIQTMKQNESDAARAAADAAKQAATDMASVLLQLADIKKQLADALAAQTPTAEIQAIVDQIANMITLVNKPA